MAESSGVTSANAAAAQAAEEARKAAEEARRKAAEEARQRAQAAQKEAQQAQTQAKKAEQRAETQQNKVQQARSSLHEAKPADRAEARQDVVREERKAKTADREAQQAQEKWAAEARAAEEAMRNANLEANKIGERLPFSEQDIAKVQPSAKQVQEIYEDSFRAGGASHEDFAEELGIDPTTEPDRLASLVKAGREYAKLTQDPKLAPALSRFDIDSPEALHDFGQRVAREGLTGAQTPDSALPLQELKAFDQQTVTKLLQGAAGGLHGAGKDLVADPNFARALSEGRTVSRAAQVASGLAPDARKGLDELGVTEDQFRRLSESDQRIYSDAARAAADEDMGKAMSTLAEAGPRAASTLARLAESHTGWGNGAPTALQDEDAVRALLREDGAPEAVSRLFEGKPIEALEALDGPPPEAFTRALMETDEFSEGLKEMDLSQQTVLDAGAGTAGLLRAAATDDTRERVEGLTSALSANPRLADSLVGTITEAAQNMPAEEGTTEATEKAILSDPATVRALATAKNAEALELFAAGNTTDGLAAIQGKVPPGVMTAVQAHPDAAAGMETLGLDGVEGMDRSGKALSAVFSASLKVERENLDINQTRLSIISDLSRAGAANPALRDPLVDSITGIGSKLSGNSLHDGPAIYGNREIVGELLKSKQGTQALGTFTEGDDESIAKGLEQLGDKVPEALGTTIVDHYGSQLEDLGLEDPQAFADSKALPDLIRATGADPEVEGERLGHLTSALAADPKQAEALTALVTTEAAAQAEKHGDSVQYQLLSDEQYVRGLAGSKSGTQTLGALARGDLDAAFSGMNPVHLRGAVDVLRSELIAEDGGTTFAQEMRDIGLTPDQLLAADEKALAPLMQAAVTDDADERAELLSEALGHDPKLAPKIAPELAENLPEGSTAQRTFSDPKLVEELTKIGNGEALMELAQGNPGKAMVELGNKVPRGLAENAWSSQGKELTALGVNRQEFLGSGKAIGHLMIATDETLEPERIAGELAAALSEKPGLAKQLAPTLAKMAGELSGVAGEMLSDEKFVQQLASSKGGPKAIAQIASGEWTSALAQIGSKELRGQALKLAKKDPGFEQGLKDLGITGEQLRTASSNELLTLVNQARAARDAAELEELVENEPAHVAAARFDELIEAGGDPAYQKVLLEKFAPHLETLASELSAPDADLDSEEIEQGLRDISQATERLTGDQQKTVVSAFADGLSEENVQYTQFSEELRHAMEDEAGTVFSVRLAGELKSRGMDGASEHLYDQIEDAMDHVLGEFNDSLTPYEEKVLGNIQTAVAQSPSPAEAEAKIEEFRERYGDEIDDFDAWSKNLLSMANGASLMVADLAAPDVEGEQEEAYDKAKELLGQVGTAAQSESGQEYMDEVAAVASVGGATILDTVEETAEEVDGIASWAEKLPQAVGASVAIKMQQLADAGDMAGVKRMSGVFTEHAALWGMRPEQAAEFRSLTDAAAGVPGASASSLPGFADAAAEYRSATGLAANAQVSDAEVAGYMLKNRLEGGLAPAALAGTLKAVGLVASGIGVAQGIANWGDSSAEQRLGTVWQGVNFATDGASVLSLWATHAGSALDGALGAGLSKAGTAVGTFTDSLGKYLGPAGTVIDAALSAKTALAQFDSGQVAQGVVTAVAGAAQLGAAIFLATGPGIIAGIGIAAGAAVANEIIDAIGDGDNEDEVKDLLGELGVNEPLADILSNQTDDRIGVGGVMERVAKSLNISTDDLIRHLNEIPEDDERLDSLSTLVSGPTYRGRGPPPANVPASMHSLIDDYASDDNPDGTEDIPEEEIQQLALRLQEEGLAPVA